MRHTSSIRRALGLLAFLPALAHAQDYDAGSPLIARLRAVPVGGNVAAHWLEGGKRLWFADGGAYAIVDARTGVRSTVERPPGDVASLPAYLPPRPSGGGEETELTIANRTATPVDAYLVDGGGQRTKYATVAAGASWFTHTCEGHTWLLTDPTTGRSLAAYTAVAGPGAAIWDGTPPPRPSRRRTEGLSPDGKRQAFVRDSDLWLREDGKEIRLSTDAKPGDLYEGELWWSPDGAHLAALRTEKGLIIQRPGKPTVDVPYDKPGDRIDHPRLVVFDVVTGKETPADERLAPNPFNLEEFHWSRDSKEIFYVYNQRGHQIERLLAADAATGRVRTVVEEKSRTFVDYSQKTSLTYLDATNEALWTSERSGWNHVYLVNLAKGALKPVTQGKWVVRSVEDVDEKKRQVTLRVMGIDPAQDPYPMHFVRVGFDGSGLTRLTTGDGTHRLTPAPDGESYLDVYSRVDLPPVTELHAHDGRLLAMLARGDDAALKKAGWVAPERFVAKARDGKTDVYGIVYRPANFDPAKKYPVIEDIYAGPHDFFVPKTFAPTWGDMRLTELGFVVVRIDGMGTNWRSKAFHDVCYQNLADAGFPDRILWMRAAAKTRPWLDLDRVGVVGTSAGVQSAASGVLRFGDFYKAAVADCGCHDNRLDKIWWNEAWMGWPVGPAYAANSNADPDVVKNLKRPLYLMVGDVDTNVDPVSTGVVVDALKAAGKPYELLVVEDSNHGVLGKPRPYRKMQEFFVRELRP